MALSDFFIDFIQNLRNNILSKKETFGNKKAEKRLVCVQCLQLYFRCDTIQHIDYFGEIRLLGGAKWLVEKMTMATRAFLR